MSTLGIVTATTNLTRAKACIESWHVPQGVTLLIVLNGAQTPEDPSHLSTVAIDGSLVVTGMKGYQGTVKAFRRGVEMLSGLIGKPDIIACLHDDLEILQPDWVTQVIRHFDQVPACGLLGFGGAVGLGDDDIYRKPYEPVQLARRGFRSNLVDAEVHGHRSALRQQVVCLDGFSQIGRREFWEGKKYPGNVYSYPPWRVLDDLGVVHHAYDGMLGCLAKRYGWEVWYLPIRCRHLGGQTAVGDTGYQEWAKAQREGGDHGFWQDAHRIWYEKFRDVLPLRL